VKATKKNLFAILHWGACNKEKSLCNLALGCMQQRKISLQSCFGVHATKKNVFAILLWGVCNKEKCLCNLALG
jgi:hypothetical protein